MVRVRGSVCRIHKCKRAPSVDGMCKTHAIAEADRLFSLAVRSVGRCEASGAHKGNLQCAHGFSRSYKAVRWDRRNAWCLCAGHHTFYTHHPIEWDLFLLDNMGLEQYHQVRKTALTHVTPDLELVLAELRATA